MNNNNIVNPPCLGSSDLVIRSRISFKTTRIGKCPHVVMAFVLTTLLSSQALAFGLPFFNLAPQKKNQASTPSTEAQDSTKTSAKVTKTSVRVVKATPKTPAALPIYYGPGLCVYPQYQCVTVKSGESWTKLFPDEKQRDLVQRVNRTYNSLWPGKIIAVPRDLATVTLIDLAPFPHTISEHEKQVVVDQDKLAWGAYDANGQLVNWGPIASGRDRCPDSANACLTLTGIYRVFSKEDGKCKSDIFPIGKGGAPMPYCMYFHKGFALHGSEDIPGYRASHGCVRMFVQDAMWLNHEFVETANELTNNPGTKVIVRPVTSSSSGSAAS